MGSRKLIGGIAASFVIAVAALSPNATSAQGQNPQPSFEHRSSPPQPFAPSAIARAGESGCHWTREQAFVGGKLVWRPLHQCYFGW